jgi:hypothetical protein
MLDVQRLVMRAEIGGRTAVAKCAGATVRVRLGQSK